MTGVDSMDRAIDFEPLKGVPCDPRHMIAGHEEDLDGSWTSGFFDRGAALISFNHHVVVGVAVDVGSGGGDVDDAEVDLDVNHEVYGRNRWCDPVRSSSIVANPPAASKQSFAKSRLTPFLPPSAPLPLPMHIETSSLVYGNPIGVGGGGGDRSGPVGGYSCGCDRHGG